MIEYIDPDHRRPVFKTITFFVQMLRPGERTLPLRQTASLLVAPFEGQGSLDHRRPALRLGAVRHLAVPGGAWCEHVNGSDKEPAILFVASDEPTLKTLACYQEVGPRRRRRGDDRAGSLLSYDVVRAALTRKHSASNTTLVAHIDCPGGGQVWVEGTTLYVGHMRQPSGTTIVDVADPTQAASLLRASTCRTAGTRTRCGWPTAS